MIGPGNISSLLRGIQTIVIYLLTRVVAVVDGSPVTTLTPPTGSTQDPCRDNIDINCLEMNATLNICSQPDSPPTVMYCPKFCGLCTPVCVDSPDVDCKLANDTNDICGQGTLAAVNYCPHFCGYCSGKLK